MDLAGWLRSLGLEQYEAAFRENEMSGEYCDMRPIIPRSPKRKEPDRR